MITCYVILRMYFNMCSTLAWVLKSAYDKMLCVYMYVLEYYVCTLVYKMLSLCSLGYQA